MFQLFSHNSRYTEKKRAMIWEIRKKDQTNAWITRRTFLSSKETGNGREDINGGETVKRPGSDSFCNQNPTGQKMYIFKYIYR